MCLSGIKSHPFTSWLPVVFWYLLPVQRRLLPLRIRHKYRLLIEMFDTCFLSRDSCRSIISACYVCKARTLEWAVSDLFAHAPRYRSNSRCQCANVKQVWLASEDCTRTLWSADSYCVWITGVEEHRNHATIHMFWDSLTYCLTPVRCCSLDMNDSHIFPLGGHCSSHQNIWNIVYNLQLFKLLSTAQQRCSGFEINMNT